MKNRTWEVTNIVALIMCMIAGVSVGRNIVPKCVVIDHVAPSNIINFGPGINKSKLEKSYMQNRFTVSFSYKRKETKEFYGTTEMWWYNELSTLKVYERDSTSLRDSLVKAFPGKVFDITSDDAVYPDSAIDLIRSDFKDSLGDCK